jgi:hypothetical protein
MRVAQHPAADAEHHRAMPPHQRLEGSRVALAHEPLDELAIAQPRAIVAQCRPAQVVNDGIDPADCHVRPPCPAACRFLISFLAAGRFHR